MSAQKKNNKLKLAFILILIVLIVSLLGKINLLGNKNTQKYADYAKENFQPPSYNVQLKQYVVSGLLDGYGNNTLTIDISEGTKVFQVGSNTVMQLLIRSTRPSEGQSAVLDTAGNYTFNDFVQKVPTGAFLQIFYQRKGDALIAAKIYYIPDFKFTK